MTDEKPKKQTTKDPSTPPATKDPSTPPATKDPSTPATTVDQAKSSKIRPPKNDSD